MFQVLVPVGNGWVPTGGVAPHGRANGQTPADVPIQVEDRASTPHRSHADGAARAAQQTSWLHLAAAVCKHEITCRQCFAASLCGGTETASAHVGQQLHFGAKPPFIFSTPTDSHPGARCVSAGRQKTQQFFPG